MTRTSHRIDVASLAASILCLFAFPGCGEEEPVGPTRQVRAAVVSGDVQDAQGRPVGGARIYLAQEEPRVAVGARPGTPVEPLEMRRTLAGVTDEEGRYVVHLPGPEDQDRTVWLTAQHAEFPFSADGARALLVEAGIAALPGPTLRVLRGGALIGRVEDEQGQGLPEVEVILRSPLLRADFRTRSGIDGIFRYPLVPEGPVRVRLATGDETEVGIDVVAAGEVSLPDSLVVDAAKRDG
jgi:hypothetical protein